MLLHQISPYHRAYRSFQGLSLGDAFGQQFFVPITQALAWIEERTLPPAPWYVTDDTITAISILHILETYGAIDQDALAHHLAAMYQRHQDRGYGGTAHRVFREIHQGRPWKQVATEIFDGMGSMGNGAAMRAAPIGAFFAEDLEQVTEQTRRSAEVTHAHPDAQDGAIAVAVAAALLVQDALSNEKTTYTGEDLLQALWTHTPSGPLRAKLQQALRLPLSYQISTAARVLGNGERLLAIDTVPFALWCVARGLGSWEETLWDTVSALGDADTTCAIAGSLAALVVPPPTSWTACREDLSPLCEGHLSLE
ncbi:MAG: ADP-ribosylglycohydrolase family protein [Myxococcales bacterium]|nr:ADP-ribosylglycohydrolase family protein [Myxococcales bacterium]